MISAVVHDHFENGKAHRRFFAVSYSPDAFSELPWGAAQFNCVILLLDSAKAFAVGVELARSLVRCNVGWVQVAGADSEWLHDVIDQASVQVGRQQAVGDGNPMTSWHDERSVEEMVDLVANSYSGPDFILAVSVGSEEHFVCCVDRLKRRLAAEPCRCSEISN